jgi:hypothetical protein
LSPPSRTESPSMNDEEQVSQARTPAAAADAEKLQLRGSRPWKFAESSGNSPAMARSSTCVARCPSATASGVVATSSRDRRVPIGCRRPTTIRDSRRTEVTSPPTTSGLRTGSATNVTTHGDEDQRAARQADVAEGDRREAER